MEPLRISICGGETASLCLAYVLCQASEHQVSILEASTGIRDEGAAIGL